MSGRTLSLAVLSALLAGSPCPNASAVPQDADAAFQSELQKAQDLLGARKYEDAIKAFKHANKLRNGASPECYVGLASAYLKLGAHKDAVKACDELLRYASSTARRAQGHNLKGVSLVAMAEGNAKKLREAESEFRAALELLPNDATVHFNLGTVLLKQGRDMDGIEEMKRCLATAPQGSFAAEARRLMENPRRARENFAPDFSLTTVQGEFLSSDEMAGKVVVLDFWATWCEPCVQAVPELRRLYKKLPKGQFLLVSISVDDDESAWHGFVAKNSMDWPQFLDRERKFQRLFAVNVFPTYIVIDGEGIMRRREVGSGGLQAAALEEEIKKSLKNLSCPEKPKI